MALPIGRVDHVAADGSILVMLNDDGFEMLRLRYLAINEG